ncbi:MAG: ATP-binding protein, partial [Oscillospiraceae bacterium]
VKLTKKPNTKDVFAFIYTQNIHKEKIANYIVNHAATKVSDMIMYIESRTGDFVCYKKGLKEPISSANYDEVIENAIRREIQGFTGEDIETIIKEMKLSNILRELENQEDYVFVTHFKDKNGKYQCKKMQFSYLDKTLGSIIHVRTDVTELYEQEQEKKEVLTHALQAAEQANKAKSRFLSSMSHDIRTPMNAIIGMSQLAQYDLNDKNQVAESLAIIDNSSRHLLDLINDVLDMSKIESGGIKLQMEKISIRHEMDNIYQMMYSSFAAKRQELKLTVAVKHDRVIGDKSRMHRVLINLLGNALKFTQDGGRVEISVEEIETDSEKVGKYRFSVSDNGQGIAKENFENIFKPFVREGVAAINHIEGTGLGLSIVKSIVEACGGIIYVDSEVGKGSRFTIEISQLLDDNTLIEAPIVTKEEQRINAMPKMKGLHVLLVEDHPVNTLVAQKMFEKCGAIVDTAENGQIGCDKFCNSENGYYDIIFMDIQMPVMNGYDATGAIRASNHPQGKSIPIVAMTANAFAQDVRESENAGMNGHIAKPISPLAISKVIKTLNLER